MDLGTKTEPIRYVLGALFVLGLLYNALVAALQRRGYDEGYTALLVVGGVLGTLAGAAIVTDVNTVLLVLACFAASGTPMIVGSWWRYVCRRRQARRDVKDDET